MTDVDDGLRSVELDGRRILYRLKPHPRRRVLSVFVIAGSLVEVRTPPRTSVRTAEAFLRRNAAWVLGHVAEEQTEAVRLKLHDGMMLPYRGGRARLRLGMPADRVIPVGDGTELWLKVSADAQAALLQGALTALLRQAARRVIGSCWGRVMQRARRLPAHWQLSGARRRWGVCTSRGTLRFSWRLVAFTDEEIEYVIAHELAHLMEFNHSPAFWREVERILPDWRERHDRLQARTAGERYLLI